MNRRAFATASMATALANLMEPIRRASAVTFTQQGAAYFTDAVLTSHTGERFRFYSDLLKGRQVLINFVFVGCTDVCDGVTANLAAVQKLLDGRVGRDVTMLSITLQPEFDTSEVLRYYADRFEIGPGWHFLTGDPADVEALRRRLGFADIDPVLDQDIFQHAAMLRIGIEPLERWAMAPALLKPDSLLRTINRVLLPATPPG